MLKCIIVKKIKKFVLSLISKPVNWFKKLSLKKKIFVIVGGLILFLVASGVIQKATQPPPYITEKVKKSDITQTVTETGNITAESSAKVYSPSNGIVKEVFVENGQSVSEGELLFTVESSATEQEQQAALSTYLTAKTALNSAESSALSLRSSMYTNWEIFRNLATNDTYENSDDTPDLDQRKATEFQVAQDNWLAAEKKYKDQQTAVSQARAQVGTTWLAYQATQDAEVKAPISGVVANVAIIPSGSVRSQASASLTETITPALFITSPAPTEAVIALSESDILQLQSGQNAIIDVNAIDDKEYKGIVRRVDSVGTLDQGVNRYKVYIEILDADSDLRSGMTADVEIITQEVKGVLSVPNSAIKPYQGKKAVRIVGEKGEIKYITVRVGVKGDQTTQILEGLDEGQEIITSLSNEQLKRPGLLGN